jgi:hypothetical protein
MMENTFYSIHYFNIWMIARRQYIGVSYHEEYNMGTIPMEVYIHGGRNITISVITGIPQVVMTRARLYKEILVKWNMTKILR